MKVLLVFIGYLALSVATPASSIPAARYDDYKVYSLHPDDETKYSEMKKMAVDFPMHILTEFGGVNRSHHVAIEPHLQKRFEEYLNYLELKFQCIIDDLQSAIEQQRVPDNWNAPTIAPTTTTAPIAQDSLPKETMNWTHYHNVPVIYEWMDKLIEENPKLITPYIAGYSYEGRPIRAMKLSANPGMNKAIFVESNIHAVEWISSAATTCFFDNLTHSDDEELKELLNNYDWILLPVLNPDGLHYTHTVNRLWRKNRKPTGVSNATGPCYGTDLNRNFNYRWGVNAYNYDVPCDHWYAGKSGDTENEVIALERFLDTFRDGYIRMYLAFHSFGNYILLPYGHTKTEFPPNYKQMMRIAGAYADAATKPFGTEFKYGASAVVNYPVSGASKDYAYGVKNIPFTATMELRGGKYAFFLPKEQILDQCHEVTVGLKAMVKKAQEEGLFD